MTDTTVPMVRLAVDVTAFRLREDGVLTVATIERSDLGAEPVRALPGILVRSGESITTAAERALAKVRGLKNYVIMRQIAPVSDRPDRDHRGHSLSLPLIAFIEVDDPEIVFTPVENVHAFDHADIIAMNAEELATRLYTSSSRNWGQIAVAWCFQDRVMYNKWFYSFVRQLDPDTRFDAGNLSRAFSVAMTYATPGLVTDHPDISLVRVQGRD